MKSETSLFSGKKWLALLLLGYVLGGNVPDCTSVQRKYPGFSCQPYDKMVMTVNSPGKVFLISDMSDIKKQKLVKVCLGNKEKTDGQFQTHKKIAKLLNPENVVQNFTQTEYERNIVQSFEVIEDTQKLIYGKKEFKKQANVSPLDIKMETIIMHNLAEIFMDLHSKGFVYPENNEEIGIKWVLGRKRFVWGDLSFAYAVGTTIEQTYTADDFIDFRVFNKTHPLKTYDADMGVFKLGMMMYQMMANEGVVGKLLFNADLDAATIRYTIPKGVNLEAAYMICELMRGNAEDRLTIPQLIRYLELAGANPNPKGLEEDLMVSGGVGMPLNMSLPLRIAYTQRYGSDDERSKLAEEAKASGLEVDGLVPNRTGMWVALGVIGLLVGGGLVWMCSRKKDRGDMPERSDSIGSKVSDLETPTKLRGEELAL